MAQMSAKSMQYDPCGKKCCGFHLKKDRQVQVQRGRRVEARQWKKEAGL